MTVRKRNGSWQVDFTIAGQRVRKDFQSSAAAEAFELEARSAIEKGKPVPVPDASAGSYTLSQAKKRTTALRWNGKRGERTATKNAQACVDFFGAHKDLSEITSEAISDFVLALEAMGNSNGTINRKLAALSAMLRDAVEERKLASMPKIKRRKEGLGRTEFLDPKDEAVMLGLLHGWGKHDYADMAVILVDTGLRLGEFRRLQKKDRSAGMVTVWENKSDLPRSIPLTKRANEAFDRVVPFDFEDHQLRAVWDRLRVTMGREDDPHFVVHMLRHTFASRLVQRGVPLQAVQKLLGHKSITQTERYAHLAPQNFSAAIAVLEADYVPPAMR
jgi:integrase